MSAIKLRIVLALVLLIGKGASQEVGKEVVVPSRTNPFILDAGFYREGPQQPLSLYSSDFDLWKLAAKIASEPPPYPPGVGVGIGGPVAHLRLPLLPGQEGSGFEIEIYPRLAKHETGLMGISRVTKVAEFVTESRYIGRFNDKELRALCEAEGMRWLAKQTEAKPLQAYSIIGPKEGSPGVWVEKLFVVNVSDRALRIDKVFFDVLKAGTTEELREADGKKRIELLPQRAWLALSIEWDALPDLTGQSGSAGMRISGEPVGESVIRAEVNRYIEAEVKRE
jgi:hypothetical protein